MEVKVVKTQISDLKKPVKLPFKWTCDNCGTENEDNVSEMILLQYKVQKLGTMIKGVTCGECGSHHEVRLVLE